MSEPSRTSDAQHTITVHLVCRDAARAADWYVRAFGADERGRVALPDGRFMQIELRFGDSTVMLADEFPEIDPFGHKWALAQHFRDVPAEEIRTAAAAMFGGQRY
jgi:PhnB protein